MKLIAGWLAEFVEDKYLFWSGLGDITIGNKTYRGVGELANISAAREGVDIPDERLTVSLNVGDIENAVTRSTNLLPDTTSKEFNNIYTRQIATQLNAIRGDPPDYDPPLNEWQIITVGRVRWPTTYQHFSKLVGINLARDKEVYDFIVSRVDDNNKILRMSFGGEYWYEYNWEHVDRNTSHIYLLTTFRETNMPDTDPTLKEPNVAQNSNDQPERETTGDDPYNYKEVPLSLQFSGFSIPHIDTVMENLRLALLEDPGLQTVKVNWIFSKDDGRTYIKSGFQFVGRLSKPVFDGGVYTFELEQYKGTGHRPVIWSYEYWKSLYPDDEGLIFMRIFGQIIATRWPPPSL